ncbi:MAG: hypothetical protein ACP5G7_02325 [Anaerolineae bacterium]
MEPLPFGSIQLTSGDLYRRAHRSLRRLQQEPYRPQEVYRPADYDWPGDYEGRLMLALILLAQALGQEPSSLAAILDELPSHLNEHGYFGPIHDGGLVDEQQMSGNNWFLSALVSLYRWQREPTTLHAIRRVVRGLLLPTRGAYAAYPADPQTRDRIPKGGAAGTRIDGAIGRWLPSTDVGCAFIALDGASAAYQVLPSGEDRTALGALIDEMIERYLSIDVRALSFQTHATLSALRGVLQHYASTGDQALLRAARDRYATYRAYGMTENYANENWFNRPTWTEPCAVVDSFLVAMDLWRHTGDLAYLEDAHHIYWNALGHGQRPNGGFGCDTCVSAESADGAFLSVHSPGVYEATWCCTMRGGAGLAEAIRLSAWRDGDAVLLPFYHPGRYRAELNTGTFAWDLDSAYPYEGHLRLDIRQAPEAPAPLKLYVPSWAPPASLSLTINGEAIAPRRQRGMVVAERQWKPGDSLTLAYRVGLWRERPIRDTERYPNVYTLSHGPLILGVENSGGPLELPETPPRPIGNGRYTISACGHTLEPINRLIDLSDEEALASRMQVLFRQRRTL